MVRRSRANRLKKKAELIVAHDTEAKREAKADGLAVGKRVRYMAGGERWGVVKEVHLRSVVVQLTADKMVPGGEDLVVREDEVPFADVREVLGEGRLAVRANAPAKRKIALMSAPPRDGGYEYCDMGRCEEPPVKVYSVRKVEWDEGHHEGSLGAPRIVAVCRGHDEPYIEAKCKLNHDHAVKKVGDRLQNSCNCTEPAHFPMLWQMGVVFDEFALPRAAEAGVADGEVVSPTKPEFENCWCGLGYGHRGFHRKKEEDEN